MPRFSPGRFLALINTDLAVAGGGQDIIAFEPDLPLRTDQTIKAGGRDPPRQEERGVAPDVPCRKGVHCLIPFLSPILCQYDKGLRVAHPPNGLLCKTDWLRVGRSV